MIRFLLDTNICIYIIKSKPELVLKQFKKNLEHGIGISSITLSELEFGVQKSSYPEKNAANLLKFLAPIDILPFEELAARQFGILRAHLEKLGKPIGTMDMLIGAHSLALETTLVTNNKKEFSRIPGIRIKDWSEQ